VRDDKIIAERSTYQVFDYVSNDFQSDNAFIEDFIDRLIEQSISYEDIIIGVRIACEKRKHPELCKLILEEIENRRNADKAIPVPICTDLQ